LTECVDLLVNNYMFDLIAFDDMDTILEEFKRVLKKGGKLILVNMTAGESFGSGIYSLIYRISPKLFGGCRSVQLSDKLENHGFEVISREYYQQLWFPSEVILALKYTGAMEFWSVVKRYPNFYPRLQPSEINIK